MQYGAYLPTNFERISDQRVHLFCRMSRYKRTSMSVSSAFRGSVITNNCTADRASAGTVTIGGVPLVGIPTQLAVKTRANSGDAAAIGIADDYTDSRIGNTTVAPINLNFDESTQLTFTDDWFYYSATYTDGVITSGFNEDYFWCVEFAAPTRFPSGLQADSLTFVDRPAPLASIEIRPFTVNTVVAPQFGIFGNTPFATYRYLAGIDSACFANNFTTFGAAPDFAPDELEIAGIYITYATSGTSTLPIMFRLRAVYQQTLEPDDDPTYTETELTPSGVAGKLVTCRLDIPTMTTVMASITPLYAKFERAGSADSNPDDLYVWRMVYGCPKVGFSNVVRMPN